ncbi:MAG: hypothetical protein WC356_04740 [Candidatus Micrarchaeia archaeon]|jgi:hypothetical protein
MGNDKTQDNEKVRELIVQANKRKLRKKVDKHREERKTKRRIK